MASASVMMLLTYGQVTQHLSDRTTSGYMVVGPAVLAAYSAVFLGIAVLTRRRSFSFRLPVILGAVSLVMVLVQLFQVVVGRANAPVRTEVLPDPAGLATCEATQDVLGAHPDIYHIVLDRYAGVPTLREIYSYDNSVFVDALRERGFTIFDDSRCNYPRTDMSLASSLNMCYLGDYLHDEPKSRIPGILTSWIQDHVVLRFLQRHGYRFVHMGTWWGPTVKNPRAEENINRLWLSEFQALFYKMTMAYPLGALLGLDSQGEQYQRERMKFDLLPHQAVANQPTYVFAHFLLPHEGFVFDSGGHFQSRFAQARVGVSRGYLGQLNYVNRRVLALVDSLLVDTLNSPVIILQADEGPRPKVNFTPSSESATLRARFSILNALRLPGIDTVSSCPGITLVNTYRIVLDAVFGCSLGLLEDSCYLYTPGGFRNLTNVTRPLDAERTATGPCAAPRTQ